MLKDDHHCPHCKYDLTGMYASWTEQSPLWARCTECGKGFDVGRLRNKRYWPGAQTGYATRPCPNCGYDLTGQIAASLESNGGVVHCSECGRTCRVSGPGTRPRRERSSPWSGSSLVVKLLLAPFIVLLGIMFISFLIGVVMRMF